MEPLKNNPEELPDILKNLDKKSMRYDIPEGFFESMQDEVVAQLSNAKASNTTSTKSLNGFWLKVTAAAAVIAIAIGIGLQPRATSNSDTAFNDLSVEDLKWYMENDAGDWSNDDLMAVIEDAAIEEYSDLIPMTANTLEELDIEEMIEQLDDNNLINYNIDKE